jgi:hypothetical protein
MDVTELKSLWREIDARIDVRRQRERGLGRTRGALGRLRVWIVVELVLNGLAALWLGSFLGDHVTAPRFAAPALLLLAAALLAVVSGARQAALLAGIDLAEPVLASQRRVAALQALRRRTIQATLLAAPLLWVPLVVVAARSLAGLDLVEELPGWLAANLAFGLAVIPLALWVARRPGVRRSRFLARLADDLTGRSLVQARTFLAELEELERGEAAS